MKQMIARAGFAGILAATACARHAPADAADSTAVATVDAETATAVSQPFVQTVSALGTVAPRSGHIAELSAPGGTRITAVLVALGDHVALHQPLIALDVSGFRAALASASAAVEAAARAQERAARLVSEGIAARKELEQANADLARARADSGVAARTMEMAELRAPIAGVITRLNASIGATVDITQPLVEIADPSALDLILTVTPDDAARIRAGNLVRVRAGNAPASADLADGHVVDISASVDTATHGVAVRVEITHPRRELRIGEPVAGLIVVATRANAIVVPSAALVPAEDGFTVFVVDSAGVAHATSVTIGSRGDSVVEVLTGVAAGDRVVTHGAFGVDEGAHIGKVKP